MNAFALKYEANSLSRLFLKFLNFLLLGFLDVIGALNCTHVPLLGVPLGDQEPQFVNRKGFHSLNMQVCMNWSLYYYQILSKDVYNV